MAKKMFQLETKGFEAAMIKRLDSLGGDVRGAVDEALGKAAKMVRKDTVTATQHPNLPRQGEYSNGATMDSIVSDTSVHWEGQTGWVPVGFDFSRPGAGGYLITGTPKMRPAPMLHRMYRQKAYMRNIQRLIGEVITQHVVDKMAGG